MARSDTAGIPFPPPLAFIGALGLGFGIHYLSPTHLAQSSRGIDILRISGVVLGLASLLLAASAFLCFRLARTSPLPERPSTSLVVRGPFRFTRNPLYLSMSLLYAAIALFANAIWPLLFLIPAVMVINHFVIAREERYLERQFGAKYVAYCEQVRRWL
jgi:protein-S-isoprenylcysteine O-methyltransferase Ste14